MKTNRLLAVVLMAAGCGGEIGAGDELEHLGPVDGVVHVRRPEGTEGVGETTQALGATNAKAIYLNGIGRTYTAGWDDSVNGVSSVAQGQGKSSVTIPPVNMTAAQWSQFVSCVKDEFARFNIEVTDQRPATGPYIEASVGGSGAELGYGGGVGGVAPVDTYRCQPIADAVVFIFTQKSWGASPQIACEIAAQEIAHSLVPLDHEYLASDPMTYLNYNGHKTFQDQTVRCGEYQERDCYCKKTHQNSVQSLLTTLGPKSTTPPPPPPPTGDTDKPTVALTAPANGSSQPGNAPITVTATASDNVGVTAVSLYWAYSSRSMPCDAANGCTQTGNTYSWSINVGTGERQFYVTATDAAGNSAQSATHKITLTAAGTPPPPPVDAPPQVRVDSPASGTVIKPGAALNVQATIKDDGIISKVEMNWTSGGSTTAFQMHETGAGVFTFSSNLSASAAAGARSFTVTAFDDKGNKTTSPTVSMTVQP